MVTPEKVENEVLIRRLYEVCVASSKVKDERASTRIVIVIQYTKKKEYNKIPASAHRERENLRAMSLYLYQTGGFDAAVRGPHGQFFFTSNGPPDGRRPVLYISPGTFEGPVRGPKDSRAAPLSIARRPSMFFTRIGRKIVRSLPGHRPEPARDP